MRYIIHADDTPIDEAVDLTDAEDVADACAREEQAGRAITAYDTLNAEIVYRAPATPPPATHGGARPGAGRKPIAETPVRLTVTLTPAQADKARTAGKGNVAAGVRMLIEAAR